MNCFIFINIFFLYVIIFEFIVVKKIILYLVFRIDKISNMFTVV